MKNSKPPTLGLLTSTSHNSMTGVSTIRIYDIARDATILTKVFFDSRSSVNVLDLITIAACAGHSLFLNKPDLKIYCANEVAVSWCKKKICNSTHFDRQTEPLIKQSLSILRANDFTDNFKIWNSSLWGKPKDVIAGVIRPCWMTRPNSNEDDDTPF